MKRFTNAERKRMLKRGLKRIADLASGKVKGITKREFRRIVRKHGR